MSVPSSGSYDPVELEATVRKMLDEMLVGYSGIPVDLRVILLRGLGQTLSAYVGFSLEIVLREVAS